MPVALVGGVVAISFAAIFFRLAAPTHPLVAAGLRLLTAALLLAPALARAIARGEVSGRLARAAIWGGLAYAVHFGAWVTSLTLTSVASSVTLVTATPLLLAVAALVTGRDRPSGRLWLALGLALAGTVTLGIQDVQAGGSALLGDALALVGAGGMAAYMVVGRRLGTAMEVWPFMAIATGVGGVSLVVAAWALGVPPVAASWEALGWLVMAALLPQLVGHGLLTWALRYTTPVAVGIATVGEPVGATVLSWLWLGETVSLVTLAGCAMTLSAVALAVRARA